MLGAVIANLNLIPEADAVKVDRRERRSHIRRSALQAIAKLKLRLELLTERQPRDSPIGALFRLAALDSSVCF